MRRSQRAHDLHTAREIGALVIDLCGLIVGVGTILTVLAMLSAP